MPRHDSIIKAPYSSARPTPTGVRHKSECDGDFPEKQANLSVRGTQHGVSERPGLGCVAGRSLTPHGGGGRSYPLLCRAPAVRETE